MTKIFKANYQRGDNQSKVGKAGYTKMVEDQKRQRELQDELVRKYRERHFKEEQETPEPPVKQRSGLLSASIVGEMAAAFVIAAGMTLLYLFLE
jgi:hypothetical protein